jgi:hypothetical protein
MATVRSAVLAAFASKKAVEPVVTNELKAKAKAKKVKEVAPETTETV